MKMGKRYYCEYCDKTMVASPSIVKTHNSGLLHQKTVTEHYHQYKDIETILAEESTKKPCSRFPMGLCKFDMHCRFSHYTLEQIQQFEEYVANKKKAKCESETATQLSFEEMYRKLLHDKSNPQTLESETILPDSSGVSHILPWTYSETFDQFGDKLPPSLKRIRIQDMDHASIAEWGK